MFAQSQKQLRQVFLTGDVYAVCLQHALSTEKEEVMGLLIGDVDEEECISHISSCLILRRSDKQADRVEISAEQLLSATAFAERLTIKLGQPRRVVGWYHSHPHITVWPSRVDVRTQALYQKMDAYFVGLIFSVFPNETRNNDVSNSKSNEVQLTCFQSQVTLGCEERLEIPFSITETDYTPFNLNMITRLPKILREEEEELACGSSYENGGEIDPLILYHNKAHKFLGMVHITSKVARAIYEAALTREEDNQQRIAFLKFQTAVFKEKLEEKIKEADSLV